jgi:hypothetical protein
MSHCLLTYQDFCLKCLSVFSIFGETLARDNQDGTRTYSRAQCMSYVHDKRFDSQTHILIMRWLKWKPRKTPAKPRITRILSARPFLGCEIFTKPACFLTLRGSRGLSARLCIYFCSLSRRTYLCRQNLSSVRREYSLSGSKRNSGKSHKISLFTETRDCRDRYFLMRNKFVDEIFIERCTPRVSLFDTKRNFREFICLMLLEEFNVSFWKRREIRFEFQDVKASRNYRIPKLLYIRPFPPARPKKTIRFVSLKIFLDKNPYCMKTIAAAVAVSLSALNYLINYLAHIFPPASAGHPAGESLRWRRNGSSESSSRIQSSSVRLIAERDNRPLQ